jgi:hypothetical protein
MSDSNSSGRNCLTVSLVEPVKSVPHNFGHWCGTPGGKEAAVDVRLPAPPAKLPADFTERKHQTTLIATRVRTVR